MTRERAIFIFQLTYCIPIILVGLPFALMWDILRDLKRVAKNLANDLRYAFMERWRKTINSVNDFMCGIARKWELTK